MDGLIVVLPAVDMTSFLGLDIFWWTVIAGIAAVLAVIVPLLLHLLERWQRATVWIIERDTAIGPVERFGVGIRNEGEPVLMIRGPAQIVIEPRSKASGDPITLDTVNFGLQGFSPRQFPVPVNAGEELTSLTPRSVLADNLWMRDCIDACWVRGVYYTTQGRTFQTTPYRVPVDDWLPSDATARQLKPRL